MIKKTATKKAKSTSGSKTKLMPAGKQVRFHIVTLFPETFTSYIGESIIARAQLEKKIGIHFYNPRDFVKPTKIQKGKDKPYLRVDDKPYGGGPGMVIQAEPILKAIEACIKKAEKLSKGVKPKVKILFMSPGGAQFTNEMAMNWIVPAKISDFIILCGRYEGIDERVNTIFKSEAITVGPFVLTGGELPAMILIDAMARQIPGVLGNFDSREEARVASHAIYTRPEVLVYKGKKYKVPEVLLSGDHKKIEEWRELNK